MAEISDGPKRSIEEDELGWGRLVSALATMLDEQVPRSGYVLGLEGAWGSGKSSMANFIVNTLQGFADHKVIKFNPWLFGDKEAMLSDFFSIYADSLDELVAQKVPVGVVEGWRIPRSFAWLPKTIREYGESVGKLANVAGLGAALGGVWAPALVAFGFAIMRKVSERKTPLPTTKKRIVAALREISDLNRNFRITVVIDDLDRLDPSDALEMLRLVRSVADFPITTYLMCFDRTILSSQVSKTLGLDKGEADVYLEKIFQTVIPLPPTEPFALRRYAEKLIGDRIPAETLERIYTFPMAYRQHTVMDIWMEALVRTPRDVVRLMDATALGWRHMPPGSDFLDFLWLQLIKLKRHDLYMWVQQYVSTIGAYRDNGRAGDSQRHTEARSLCAILDDIDGGPGTTAGRTIHIESILPGIQIIDSNEAERRVYKFDHDELDGFEIERRLGSPSHWRQYFSFDVPSYTVSDDDIETFRRKASGEPSDALRFLEDIAVRDWRRPGHHLDVLLDRLAKIPGTDFTNIDDVAFVLAMGMDRIAQIRGIDRSYGEISLWRRAERLMKLSDPARFAALVTRGESLNWLAYMTLGQASELGYGELSSSGRREPWLNNDQLQDSIHAILSRFRKAAPHDIFSLPEPSTILYCWRNIGSHEEVQSWFRQAVSNAEIFLKAMSALRGWRSSSSTGISYPLRSASVALFMDAGQAKGYLTALSEDASLDPTQREKATQLLQDWSDENVPH